MVRERQPFVAEPPELEGAQRVANLKQEVNEALAGAFTQALADLRYPQLSTTTSGIYTPALTNVANLDGSTAFECHYIRVGNEVFVSGKVSVDPTAPASLTQLGIGLPIASNIAAEENCGGVAFAADIAGQGAAIRGDAANNRAEMAWIAGDVTNQAMHFSFAYRVIA